MASGVPKTHDTQGAIEQGNDHRRAGTAEGRGPGFESEKPQMWHHLRTLGKPKEQKTQTSKQESVTEDAASSGANRNNSLWGRRNPELGFECSQKPELDVW